MTASTCVLALACSNLTALPAGQCGNYLVEPGEDCDTYPERGASTDPWCRPPGAVGQCRYDCSSSPLQCKSGWGCGSDGICRAASGEFAEGKLSSTDSFGLELGDFTGAGKQGLLSAQVSSIELRTFDESAAPTEAFSAALQVDSVARGRLTSGDDIDDILLGYRGRVLALQGNADSAPRPIALNTRTVSSDTSAAARLLVASVAGTTRRFGILGTSVYAWDPGVFASCDAAADDALFDVDFTVDSQAAADTFLATGDFDDSNTSANACDEFAGSQVGADKVWIYGLCASRASTACNRDPARYAAVKLSAGASLVTGPFSGLVNDDALPDLVVVDQLNGVQELAVAYGVGDGSFHSDASSLPKKNGDGAFSPLFTVSTGAMMSDGQGSDDGDHGGPPNATLLATADLDADGRADFVFSSFLGLSATNSGGSPCSTGSSYSCLALQGVRWSAGTAGDFNGDGLTDVAGWQTIAMDEAPAQASLDLLLNAGNGAFNRFVVGTAGPISPLPALPGDFDGDLFRDLALAVTVPGTAAPEIQILFGSPTKPLGATAELAGVGTLVDTASGDLSDGDAASDLFLLTQDQGVQLTTFSGDSSRVPISGLVLSNGSSQPDYQAQIARAGRFSASVHDDIAVISTQMQGPPGGHHELDSTQAFVHLVRLDENARPVDSDALGGAADSLAVILGQSALLASYDSAAVAVADVDASGTDELVFIGSGNGESLVQDFVASDDRFVLSHEFTVPFTLKTQATHPGDLSLALAVVADVDADGVKDVTALTNDGVIVLRGSAGSPLSSARVTHLILPPTDSPVLTWANLDAAPTLELVRASTAGLERFDIPSWDAELTLAPKLIGSASGDIFSAFTAPAALTAGDVTGDGIDDLVLDAAGLWLFRGQPVLR